jgi:hypothetical protein
VVSSLRRGCIRDARCRFFVYCREGEGEESGGALGNNRTSSYCEYNGARPGKGKPAARQGRKATGL